jgi:hypothetical protein
MDNTISRHTVQQTTDQSVTRLQTQAKTAKLAAAHRHAQADRIAQQRDQQIQDNISGIMRAAQGEITLASGTRTALVMATDTAGQKPAQITIASTWENPARIAPDVSLVKAGRLPEEFTTPEPQRSAFALDRPVAQYNSSIADTVQADDTAASIPRDQFAASLVAGFEDLVTAYRSPIAVAMQADGNPRPVDTAAVVSIPRERLEAALVAAGEIAVDGRIEISSVPGAYKVLTGDDVGAVRNLPSIIIGFEPKEGADINALEQVGQRISTILRQESAIVSLRGVENPTTTIATLSLKEDRDRTMDGEVMRALSNAFGGATQTGPNQITTIVAFTNDVDSVNAAQETLMGLSMRDDLSIDRLQMSQNETRFALGVRIKDVEANKAEYMAKLHGEFPGASQSMKDRAQDLFERTFEQLFGAGMRPAERNYVIIDERMRINSMNTEHLEEAPMHWGARMVSLNHDRTGIEDLLSSELVLDLGTGRTVGDAGGDPTIYMDHSAPRDEANRLPRYETSKGQVIPNGVQPGTKLIKDQGLASPSYFNVGSYVIPVDNVAGTITSAKRLAAESRNVNEMYPNATNCLVHAEGLLKDAKPLDVRVVSLLERAFSPDFKLAPEPPPPPGPDGVVAAPIPVRRGVGTGSVLSQEFNNLLPHPTPGLKAGDSNYSNAVRFLQSIADTAFSQPTERDVTALARKTHGLAAGETPSRGQIAEARKGAAEWFNRGLNYELANPPGGDKAPVKLQDLHSHVFGAPIRSDHVKPMARTVSSPSMLESPERRAADAGPPQRR